jgi:hypothetical protein
MAPFCSVVGSTDRRLELFGRPDSVMTGLPRLLKSRRLAFLSRLDSLRKQSAAASNGARHLQPSAQTGQCR